MALTTNDQENVYCFSIH